MIFCCCPTQSYVFFLEKPASQGFTIQGHNDQPPFLHWGITLNDYLALKGIGQAPPPFFCTVDQLLSQQNLSSLNIFNSSKTFQQVIPNSEPISRETDLVFNVLLCYFYGVDVFC